MSISVAVWKNAMHKHAACDAFILLRFIAKPYYRAFLPGLLVSKIEARVSRHLRAIEVFINRLLDFEG